MSLRAWAPLLLLAGCDQKMREQPRLDPLEPSAFFDDGAGARPLPEGTVARGRLRKDRAFAEGRENGVPLDAFPLAPGRPDLERGRERYGIFCAPCHGEAGDGDGIVVRRGFPAPPSFHDPRLLEAPAGHFVVVIGEGFGRMAPLGYLVPPEDRWRIVAYLRALQLSRRVPASRLEPEERAALGGGRP